MSVATMKMMRLTAILVLAFFRLSQGFDYQIDDAAELELYLVDVNSGIEGLSSLHNGDPVTVSVQGIAWTKAANDTTGSPILNWTTYLNGVVSQSGIVDLLADGRVLPTTIAAGEIASQGSGTYTITVELLLDGITTTVDATYESFASGVSVIPLVLILVLAATTHMVEVSLFTGIFVGACIVAGSLKQGFFTTLSTYLLDAVSDESHGYVYLFTFFLSGLVGMMMKSGGFVGFTTFMSYWATNPIAGQMVAYISGCVIFFDDYANTLIVGESMRPLSDILSISREKLAFIVDATSAPVASITPISSWIGFEIGLIQAELDKIAAANTDGAPLQISLNGLAVFLESIKFRYYPIFMLMLMPTLIMLNRDFGPMLVAERKTQVYGRTDGGDGATGGSGLGEKHNQPEPDTPGRVWNMFIPIIVIVILIIWLLIQSGVDPSVPQTVIDMLQNSDSYSALLYGAFASAWLTLLLYHIQFKKDGSEILWPTPHVLKLYIMGWFTRYDDGTPKVRPLMNVKESTASFLYGMAHVFPATIVLTLAWASGSIMGAIGTDRLFADFIADDVDPGALPTLSFVISFIMALATGTSWGTMAIMFPLLVGPTYFASGGNPVIFYSTVAGILSGAVAGDHVSPISDTTVLTALATDCDLLKHVSTQSPYVFVTVVICILVGTLPVGYGSYPTGVAFLLGYLVMIAFTFGICTPIVSKTGRFDILTELYFRYRPDPAIDELRQDTAKAYESVDHGDMLRPFAFWKKDKLDSGGVATSGEEMPLDKDKKDDEEGSDEEEVLQDKLLAEHKLDPEIEP